MLNKFSFTCPIFNTQTFFQHCVDLRNKIFTGQKVEVRRGCQACIASGKCPAAREYTESVYGRRALYPHYVSPDEKKHGKLRAEVLEAIKPVKMQEKHLTQYGVPAVEQELIATANNRIAEQLKTAPRVELAAYVPPKPSREQQIARARPRPQFAPIKITDTPKTTTPASNSNAAASGDLAAAINA